MQFVTFGARSGHECIEGWRSAVVLVVACPVFTPRRRGRGLSSLSSRVVSWVNANRTPLVVIFNSWLATAVYTLHTPHAQPAAEREAGIRRPLCFRPRRVSDGRQPPAPELDRLAFRHLPKWLDAACSTLPTPHTRHTPRPAAERELGIRRACFPVYPDRVRHLSKAVARYRYLGRCAGHAEPWVRARGRGVKMGLPGAQGVRRDGGGTATPRKRTVSDPEFAGVSRRC
jgi:hypothetical protein